MHFSDFSLNLATRAAVAHALQLATPYTVVESPDTPYTLEVTSIIGVTASDAPAPLTFHASYGYAEDDPETHLHPLVRPMKSITANLALKPRDNSSKPYLEPEIQLRIDVPAIMTADRRMNTPFDQVFRLYITQQGRESLDPDQIARIIRPAIVPDHLASAIADTAVLGRSEAFRTQLIQLLDDWKPQSGFPDHEVTVTFDRRGYRIKPVHEPAPTP